MSINITNARRLIERLEDKNNPVAFNMTHWFIHNQDGIMDPEDMCKVVKDHPCGTAACLAGHAALIAWQSGEIEITEDSSVEGTAEEWLGFGFTESKCLFRGHWGREPLKGRIEDLTIEQAIDELNRLIELEIAK